MGCGCGGSAQARTFDPGRAGGQPLRGGAPAGAFAPTRREYNGPVRRQPDTRGAQQPPVPPRPRVQPKP